MPQAVRRSERRGVDLTETAWTAKRVLALLHDGMRMKILFETAKAAASMPLGEVELLFAEPSYEARLTACCVLDFRARKQLGNLELRDLYLQNHDRIDNWGMVDRAAPRVIGATLLGGPYDLLSELAASSDPHRRRTAMTAPLFFIRGGSDLDLEAGFSIAEQLHADGDPVVHKPVGIYLAHAGDRMPDRLTSFLQQHGDAMPRPAYRIAIRKRKVVENT